MIDFGEKVEGIHVTPKQYNVKHAEILRNISAVILNTPYNLSEKQKQMIEDLGATILHTNVIKTHENNTIEK